MAYGFGVTHGDLPNYLVVAHVDLGKKTSQVELRVAVKAQFALSVVGWKNWEKVGEKHYTRWFNPWPFHPL